MGSGGAANVVKTHRNQLGMRCKCGENLRMGSGGAANVVKLPERMIEDGGARLDPGLIARHQKRHHHQDRHGNDDRALPV